MITVGDQIADMHAMLPNWSCDQPDKRTAVWHGMLTPHKTAYQLRIEYTEPLLPEGRSNLYLQPLVEVLSPPLTRQFGNAEGSLPHVYVAHPRTRRAGPFLCLFDDEAKEWTPEDRISDTTIPWASNWLSCYECWLLTGKWFGTGKHIRSETDSRDPVAAALERYHGSTSNAALTRNDFSSARTA